MPPGNTESNMARRCGAKVDFGSSAAAALCANSVYLAAWSAPTLFYYTNVALHVVLGVVALVVLIYLAFAARPVLSRRAPNVRRQAAIVWIPFVACAGVGLWLAYAGATLSQQRALDAHGALAALGALSLAMWLGGAARRPPLR